MISQPRLVRLRFHGFAGAPTLIHFEDAAGTPTEDFGPYPKFHCADGVMYAEERLVAKFIEETQLWHCFLTENFWPIVVVKAAPA